MIYSKRAASPWLIYVFTVVIILVFTHPCEALQIIIEPTTPVLSVQATAKVDVYANNASALISMGVKVSYDPNLLSVVSAAKNVDFLHGWVMDADGNPATTGDQYTNPPVEIDNTHGSVTMLGGRLIGTSTNGLSGKVLLGSIVFRGVQTGSSNITVDRAKYHPEHPAKTFDNFVNIDGTVDEPTNLGTLAVIRVSGSCTDLDGDGYGDPGSPDCAKGAARDCNDHDPNINPGAAEICNGVDDNCNGAVDEGCDVDTDGIPDDGDHSGVAGDHPCTGGQTTNCDDNCPGVSNPGQEDADGDGVGDACDQCPNTPTGAKVDANGCPFGACVASNGACTEGSAQDCTAGGGTYLGDTTDCNWLSDGLVAYYPYNGDASDASGNFNDGIVESAVLTADGCGASDNAYAFNGSDTGIASQANGSLGMANFQAGYTIAAWINPAELTASPDDYGVIAALNGMSLRLSNNGGGLTGLLQATHRNPDGSTAQVTFNRLPVFVEAWQHVAVTWDGATNNWTLFVNGNPSDPATTTGPATLDPSVPENVAMGRDNANDQWYFNGLMDEVRIYNRTLSADEISALLATGCLEEVVVPSVVGFLQADAEAAITQEKLTVGTVSFENSQTVPEGLVASQTPASGENVPAGSPVNFVVSLGPYSVSVPNVTGLSQASAEGMITSAGLMVGTITLEASTTVSPGNVIRQTPEAGTVVAPGSAVDLVVSVGPAPAVVPDIVGISQAAAQSAITAAGLIVGSVTTAPSIMVPAGNVISQHPLAGSEVVQGSTVDFVISSGAPSITVPDVVGLSQFAAEAALTNAGLSVGSVSFQNSQTVLQGLVISQTPASGESVAAGSPVNFVVSLGPVSYPKDCREILVTGDSVGDGAYVIDPDGTGGQDPITVQCLMSLSEGGWTKLTDVVAQTAINTDSTLQREYLYEKGGKWYRTPMSNLVWDWNSPKTLTGTYYYTGGSFYCGSSGEVCRYYGVSCSNGGGNQWKALIYYLTGKNASDAKVQLCQDRPGIFGSACQTGVTVYIRSGGSVEGTVPNAVGLSQAAAEALLTSVGFQVGSITHEDSNEFPSGEVMSQNPLAGTLADLGTAVDLVVSSGPARVSVFLVSSGRANSVLQYDQTTGAFLNALVPSGSGGLENPQGLAIGPDGNLYVASFNTDSVLRYNGTTGAFIDAFVPNVGGGFGPADLAFGPDGNLYVSDFSAGVLRYDGTTGAFIDIIIPGWIGNSGLVFGADGNLYVSIAGGANEVRRYDGTTGDFIDTLVPSGSGGLTDVRDLTFGPDGNVYAVSAGNHSVLRYNGSTGAFIDAFVPSRSGGLDSPVSLLFGPDGNLYVTGFDKGVLRYNGTTGEFIDTFIPAGPNGLGGATFLIMAEMSPGPNHAPVLAPIGDQTVHTGNSLSLNLTAADADGDSIVFSASGLPAFAVLTDNHDGTAALTLAPTAGQAGQYQLTVTATDAGSPAMSDSETFVIAVHTISLEVNPSAIDFGPVMVGSTEYRSFTIANTGTVALQVTGIQSSGGVFSVYPPANFTIEPGDPVRTVSIGFAPTAEGEFSGVVSVLSNAGEPVAINVTGTGKAVTEPGDISTPSSLEFGSVAEGSVAEQLLTITNAGKGPLTVSTASTDSAVFSVSAAPGDILPYSINPGASRNLSVRLAPPDGSAGTAFSGKLTITCNDPDEPAVNVALSGKAIAGTTPEEENPALGARVVLAPEVFDLITASSCANVSGTVDFGPDAASADSFLVVLRDQGGTEASSSESSAIPGPGVAEFGGIDACGLVDGRIDVEVIYRRNGSELGPAYGTPAVKYTVSLEPPILDHVPPLSFSPAITVCGTSRPNTTVRIEGGASVVSKALDAATTRFCLEVPLRINTQNTLIASAIDDLAPAPKPVAYAQPVQVMQVDLAKIVIASATSRPLTQAEIEDLVDRGIIDIQDAGNFNVSMFTVVFTIGSFPVPITISQPVVLNPIPGSVSYGLGGGGWFVGGGGGGRPTGVLEEAAQIVVITAENGQTIPGVIIIDGRIKTLKEFFQVTLALWNISSGFTLSDMAASINLPPGLTPIATGLGSEVPDVNLSGAVDTVVIGEIAPGETGVGQFIIRGDAAGTYNITVDFEGFVTGGGLPEPIPVSGSAGTSVQVLGPPELKVVLHYQTNAEGPDVIAGDVVDLVVEITNISNRPALYSSLELFVGGGAKLVGIDGKPIAESSEIRSFGHIQPGQTVTAAFRVQSQLEGEIIACQAIAAENITLSIDIGPDGVPCNIVNMYPANFEPLPPEAAPVVLGVNPANGQTNIPITTSVFAVLTPRAGCITADTWTNVVTDTIDPLDPSKGLQVLSADLVQAGTFYLEELNAQGQPVRHIPVDLTVVDPPAGGTTIAVLRLGLANPLSQFFLSPNTTYRATLVGGSGGVCSAASGAKMENDYVWIFTTGTSGGGTNPSFGACCLPNSSCTLGNADWCGAVGGVYGGDNTECASVACVWDADGDGVPNNADLCPDTPTGESVDGNGCSASQRDTDGDGVRDDVDLCPSTRAGVPVDGSGCWAGERDSDGDGVMDNVDLCPNTPNGIPVDGNGCSAGQRDTDGDGVPDDVDLCPSTPAGVPVDKNGCSAGQRDSDGDGVMDNMDLCPNTPQGVAVDESGCPIGACVFSNGTCYQISEQKCLNAGDLPGAYQGDGTSCEQSGACILPNACCTEGTEQACSDAGGTYQGDRTVCAEELFAMPNVIGMADSAAFDLLSADCLEVEVECDVTQAVRPAGEVVRQNPAAGDYVNPGDTVVLGVSAGISADAMVVEGGSTGVFRNPQGPSGMVTEGVGTANFAWGTPLTDSAIVSRLTYVENAFSANTEEEFLLGTLIYTNGTIAGYSDADTVELKVDIAFSTPDGVYQSFAFNLELIDTPNVDGTSPEKQADVVKLSDLNSPAVFTIDDVTYTLKVSFGDVIGGNGGFSERSAFFVNEGESALVELRGKITACVEVLHPIDSLSARAKSGKIDIVWPPVEGAALYKIYRSTTHGGPYTLIAGNHVTSYAMYADFGLTNGVTYYYVVRWVSAYGQESPDSNEASAKPSARSR